MTPKRKRAVPVNNGSDVEEPTVRQAATNVGFYDPNIDSKIYIFWGAQVHRGIQNWNCFGPGEAGTSRWSELCEWAASQEGMAPWGMLAYTTDSSIRRNVIMICDDIAEKARSSQQSMWETISRARAAYRESNPGAPAIIEHARWPLPGAQELGPVNTGISFMPKNARGRGIPLVNATAASNIERTRVESRAVGIPFGSGMGLAGGGAGTAGAVAGAGAGPAGAGAGAGTGARPTGAAAGLVGAGVSSTRDEAGSSREGAGPAGAGKGRGGGRGPGLPAAKLSKRAAAGPAGPEVSSSRAGGGPAGAGRGRGRGRGRGIPAAKQSKKAAAGPAGAEAISPEDEAGSEREGAGPAGAGRGRGRGRGRGLPAAKQSKRAAAGPTGARATAGPAGAEVSFPEDEAGSSREGAGPAEAEVEGKGRGRERGRGLPTARRSKKFVRRRGVGPRASVPPRPLPPPPSLSCPLVCKLCLLASHNQALGNSQALRGCQGAPPQP